PRTSTSLDTLPAARASLLPGQASTRCWPCAAASPSAGASLSAVSCAAPPSVSALPTASPEDGSTLTATLTRMLRRGLTGIAGGIG
ncbi:hypothetical protein FALBO_17334, partial [Fusarium albosuccineum]